MENINSPIYWDGVSMFENYQGRCNRILTEREIINSYHTSKVFFFERAEWHENTAIWYRNQSALFLRKSEIHKQLAKNVNAKAIDYWALAFDASLAIMRREKVEKRGGEQRVG